MGVYFPVREKLGNFEHTGKVWKFYQKYWKMMEFYPKYWERERILTIFFSNFLFKWRLLYLLNSLNKTLENKMLEIKKKILEKSERFVSQKKREP